MFTELDDDAYVDFELDDVAQESDAEQDLDTARLREQATEEARQVAADYICTLASHSCYGHDHSLADEQIWTRPKSLWDVA